MFYKGINEDKGGFMMTNKMKISWFVLKMVVPEDDKFFASSINFLTEVEKIFKNYKYESKAQTPMNERNVGKSPSKEAVLNFSVFIENLKKFCKSSIFETTRNGLMSNIDVLFSQKKQNLMTNFEKTMTSAFSKESKKVQYQEYDDNPFLKYFYNVI